MNMIILARMKLSTRLRAMRARLGYTQQQFARLVGVSVVNYRRYELDVTTPPAARLAAINDLLSALELLHE